MPPFEKVKTSHVISLGISPNEADISIVSVNTFGTSGQLNKLVLDAYGYSEDDLPSAEQLTHAGFGSISDKRKKPVLCVVTVDSRKTADNLASNLFKVLVEFTGWFRGKKLWIPLMGTGAGGLSLEESYRITVEAINKFQDQFPTETTILLSIPASKEGRKLYDEVFEVSRNSEPQRPEAFLNSLNAKFYFVGTIWNKDEQLPRFYEEGIWEKGHGDETYSEIINTIAVNDILIAKSSYRTAQGESNLKIKAIAIVEENEQDGVGVSVRWVLRDLRLDVKGLGYYSNTVSAAEFSDVAEVFSLINQNLWRSLLPPSITRSNRIAGLISDADRGADYLDIAKDVTAFARVIAAKSFQPPLAIALFGRWGSGKSFFMRKLKSQVEDFSTRNANNMYCQGVAHIQFNAWSYMDANLWASFVNRIFEGLNEYISNNVKSDEEKANVRNVLTNKLNITKEETQILEEKKNAIKVEIRKLEDEISEKRDIVEEKIEKLTAKTTWDILKEVDKQFDVKKKIRSSLNENKSFIKTEDELEKIVPEKYWDNPEEAYREAQSGYVFIREFLRKDKIVRNIVWVVIILGIILLAPIWLKELLIDLKQIDFVIPQAILSVLVIFGAVWRRALLVYNRLQPIIASFWKIKTEYEFRRSEALAKFEQEERRLKIEIDKAQNDLLLTKEQLQKAESVKSDLEFRIKNALASEALYTFIDKRSKSDDYKKHLGIISIIRNDFEILNGLFTDHNLEVSNSKDSESFHSKFEKPLERIVLYIDDLDRCPEENVVQVLEAVNLLMAFPLFIVVVGVDPRWVRNALMQRYSTQFTSRLSRTSDGRKGREPIEPSDYLEKIFQVPFHLKEASSNSVKEMIRQLALSKPSMPIVKPDVNSFEDNSLENDERPVDENIVNVSVESSSVVLEDEFKLIVYDEIELLELSEREVNLLQEMGELIGPNPRSVKRFVNTYRIIKAHDDDTTAGSSEGDDQLAMLFLLAISCGQYKTLKSTLDTFIDHDFGSPRKVLSYLVPGAGSDKDFNLKESLRKTISSNATLDPILEMQQVIFRKHCKFINRFTF